MMESNWKIGTQTPATLSTPTASTTRQKYFLPKRIILLRHGESLGNIDANAYRDISDWTIPLTRRGERQSLRAAQDLWKLIQGEALFTYYSPYKRARETWEIVQHHLEEQGNVDVLGAREEPRIVEQQFGNYQNPRE
jgi:broad specificity phosphatase PhoE